MLGQNASTHINASSADLLPEVQLLLGLSFAGIDHVVTNYLGDKPVQVEHQALMLQLVGLCPN